MILAFTIFFLFSSSSTFGFDQEDDTEIIMLGDVRETEGFQNNAEIEELARFAVDEHNKKENALLEFGRVVKAKEQVVSGMLHHLTVEAMEAGKKKIYEAKVWVKHWENFKELQEFKHVGDSPSGELKPMHIQHDHAVGCKT